MVTKPDPSLFPEALRAKAKQRIQALFTEELHADLKYIQSRSRYEKLKAVDHKAVNKAVKKVLPAQVIKDTKAAITNPSDRATANWLSDVKDGLEGVLERMSRPGLRKKSR